MDGNVVAFFVPTVIFILFVMPVWVYMHYRTKQQAQSALSVNEREDLERLAFNAQRMLDRIDTLEAILDAESPGWRKRMDDEDAIAGCRDGAERLQHDRRINGTGIVSKEKKRKTRSGSTGAGTERSEDYQRAMGRLEEAVRELGDVARENFADRAADVLQQTATKLRGEGASAATGSSRDTRCGRRWLHLALGPRRAAGALGQRLLRHDRCVISITPGCGASAQGSRRTWDWRSGSFAVWPSRSWCSCRRSLCRPTSSAISCSIQCHGSTSCLMASAPAGGRGGICADVSGTPGARRRIRHRINAADERRESRAAEKRERKQAKRDARKAVPEPRPRRHQRQPCCAMFAAPSTRPNCVCGRMEGHVTSGRYELQRELRKLDT